MHQYRRIMCMHCGTSHDVPVYCGDRWCSICSGIRRSRVYNRLKFVMTTTPTRRYHSWYHWTFGIASEEDLASMVKSLLRYFRRLRQRSYFKKKVHGGAFVIEVTHGDAGWHAHIHALIYSHWMDWDRLRLDWLKISKGRSVYVRPVGKVDLASYLCKYLSKPDIPEADLGAASSALKGVRLFNPFGKLSSAAKSYKAGKPACKSCGFSQWTCDLSATGSSTYTYWLTDEEAEARRSKNRPPGLCEVDADPAHAPWNNQF